MEKNLKKKIMYCYIYTVLYSKRTDSPFLRRMMDKPSPTVELRELHSVSCAKP